MHLFDSALTKIQEWSENSQAKPSAGVTPPVAVKPIQVVKPVDLVNSRILKPLPMWTPSWTSSVRRSRRRSPRTNAFKFDKGRSRGILRRMGCWWLEL